MTGATFPGGKDGGMVCEQTWAEDAQTSPVGGYCEWERNRLAMARNSGGGYQRETMPLESGRVRSLLNGM